MGSAFAGGAGVVDCGGCDEAAVEATLLAAEEVPLEVELVAAAALGVSVPCEVLVVWTDWFDDERLEPPTNRLKREFMLDMRESHTCRRRALAENE